MFNKSNLNTSSNLWFAGACTLFAVNLVGCSKNSPPVNPVHVQDVSVNTVIAPNQDEWIDFAITISTMNYTVAGITLPILDPRDNTKQYGSLSLQPVLCSVPANCPYGNGAQIGVNLDLTTITGAKGVAPLLPNGSALPVAGLQNSTVIALPIANTGAVVYFAAGKGVAMLGTAVPFTQLNSVGQTIPGANIFLPVTINTPKGNFTLLPGFFTSLQPNQTGVGFFADLSGIIPKSAALTAMTNPTTPLVTGSSFEFQAASARSMQKAPAKNQLVFPATYPDGETRVKLYKELYQSGRKGGYLTVN